MKFRDAKRMEVFNWLIHQLTQHRQPIIIFVSFMRILILIQCSISIVPKSSDGLNPLSIPVSLTATMNQPIRKYILNDRSGLDALLGCKGRLCFDCDSGCPNPTSKCETVTRGITTLKFYSVWSSTTKTKEKF